MSAARINSNAKRIRATRGNARPNFTNVFSIAPFLSKVAMKINAVFYHK